MPAEFLSPEPHGLVRDNDPTGRRHIRDHPQSVREAEMEPDRIGNHLCRKSMATGERITGKLVMPPDLTF